MEEKTSVRIAALADLHYGRSEREELAALLAIACETADVLLLCGDLTDHGTPEEAAMLVEDIPPRFRARTLGVLGNHDHASDQLEATGEVFAEAGVRILDGDNAVIDGVGFAGVSGFCGGFNERSVYPFGEKALRDFIGITVKESLKLETALSQLGTKRKVVLMHYAPIEDTVRGEPLEIFPFLGASRLEDPLNHFNVDVAFHGHAHKGTLRGTTGTGVKVFNVSIPVLKRTFPDRPSFFLYEFDNLD